MLKKLGNLKALPISAVKSPVYSDGKLYGYVLDDSGEYIRVLLKEYSDMADGWFYPMLIDEEIYECSDGSWCVL